MRTSGGPSLRKTERVAPVTLTSADAQLRAIREWGTIPAKDRYVMITASLNQR